MEDEASFNRSAFATPSVDPLDAAIEKLEAERAAAAQGKTGQEPEKADGTVQDTTARDEPEDDDFEDDDDTDAANTPENDVEDEDEDLQESEQQKKPEPASTPDAKKKGKAQGTDSDDDSTLSRKQRGKLIQELRQQLEEEQQQKEKLQQSLKAQQEDEEKLNSEVSKALGTDEQMEKDLQAGLQGDDEAANRYRIYKANREFFGKLVTKARTEHSNQFMASYWQEVAGLPGVTEEALKAPQLSTILKNIYDAGVASVKDGSTDEVEKLKADVDTWRGRYRTLKAKAGGGKRSPLGGGGGASTESTFNWKAKYTDPKTGLLTDEADALVAQYGVEALMDPNFKKR